MAQIALNYSAAQINEAIAKINNLVSVIEGSIVQLYDGNTAIYPLTKAEAVFFDNDDSKTLDKQINQLEQHTIDCYYKYVSNKTISPNTFINWKYTIKSGCIVKNNGTNSIALGTDSSLSNRIDILAGDQVTLSHDYLFIKNLETAQVISLEIFNPNSIADSTININKLSFHTTKNLINTSTIRTETYCNTDVGQTIGYTEGNNSFATDKIPVEVGKTYIYSVNGFAESAKFFILVNSLNKSVRKLENVGTFTVQEGEKFVIVTGSSVVYQRAQLEEGTEVTPYEDYKLVISKDVLPADVFTRILERTEVETFISPNILNRWGELRSLTIKGFQGAQDGYINEYMLEFKVSGDSFVLILPEGVRWLEEPTWEDGYIYQVSIVNNLAVFAGWKDLTNE